MPRQSGKGTGATPAGSQNGGRLPKVIIIGGGVAGLSAAHELQERGFNVTIYERRKNKDPDVDIPVAVGGKARSFPVDYDHAYVWPNGPDNPVPEDLIGLPAEHGFHFFPGFYQHIVDTFRRIPLRDSTGRYVVDNLMKVERAAYAREGRAFFRLGTVQPDSLRQFWKSLRRLFLQNPNLGLSPYEAGFAAAKLVNAMTMCDERREAELDAVPWAEYMDAREMSDAYRTAIIDGLTQNFVAMDSRLSSTKTSINILARLLHDITTPGSTADRVLNGPMNEAWFTPWRKYLTEQGPFAPDDPRLGQAKVNFENREIIAFSFDPAASRIKGLYEIITRSGGTSDGKVRRTVKFVRPDGDDCIYLLAVPVEAATSIFDLTALIHPQIFDHAPALKALRDLVVSWMAGIMFYLKKDIEMSPGHIVYLNSRWAITSISQNQFWKKKVGKRSVEQQEENGVAHPKARVRGILSAILSDWDRPGIRNRNRTAKEALNAGEIAEEAMAQIRAHIRDIRDKDVPENDRTSQTPGCPTRDERELEDENIVGYTLGTAITLRPDMRKMMSAGEFSERSIAPYTALLQNTVQADGMYSEGARVAKKPSLSAPLDDVTRNEKILNKIVSGNMGKEIEENDTKKMLTPANQEPLFINTVNSWPKRPTATTAIGNLYLAADYIKTNTDMGTMEGANEAARRAVNGILDALDSKRTRCKIFTFEEPAVLAPFKAIDKHLFSLGLPHPSFLVDPLLAFGAKFSNGLRNWTSEDYDGAS